MRQSRHVGRSRSNRNRRGLQSGEHLEPRWVLDGTVVLSEIMYNPSGDEETLEFIELHNQMAVDMEVSKWSIVGGVDFTFPTGTVVPTDGYLIVAKAPAALQAASELAQALGPYAGQLSNAGERLELRDHNDRLMDWVQYNDTGPWPDAADGTGVSLAKVASNTASPAAENWASSIVVGGTPGGRNFPQDAEPNTMNSIVSLNDTWKYDASGADLGTEWRQPTFDDTAWLGGPRPTLIGYWPLDGDGTAAVGNDGIPAGSPSATADRNDQPDAALSFRGPRREYLDIPGGGGLDGATSGTISLWVKWNSFQDFDCCGPTYGAVLSRQANRQFSDNIIALDSFEPNGSHVVWRQSGEPASETIAGTTTLVNNAWHHIAVTFSPEQSELFVDGVSQGTAVGGPMHSAPDTPLSIGAWSGDGDGYSTSSIDDVAIWNDALDERQIVALASQQTTPMDLAGPDRAPYVAGDAVEGNTALPLGPTTYYFRKTFSFNESPSRTQLRIDSVVDDGAVFYLNGTEVHRTNMPAGAATFDTLASSSVAQATSNQGIVVTGDNLQGGTNVLAVEVHQATLADTDVAFDAQVMAITSAPGAELFDLPALAINEVTGGSAATFWLELINHGNTPVDLNGYVIESSAGNRTVLTGPTIEAGQLHIMDSTQLGFAAETGDRVSLLSPDRSLVIDTVRVQDDTQGRIPDGLGPILRPDMATPGTTNVLDFHDEIVINEIFYHAPAEPSFQGVPPTVDQTVLLPFDASWRYSRDFNFGATDLPVDPGPDWAADAHMPSVDWLQGQGPLGISQRRTPEPINKRLTSPLLVSNFITTYYFETEFGLTQQQLDSFDDILLRHMIDDGAVFYVNGQPIHQFNLPDGPVDGSTLAVSDIGTAAVEETVLTVSDQLLALPAMNRLSVEVHQASLDSPDIVLGVELMGRTTVDPGQPPRPFAENDEEWIELLNRSDHAVDLTGWRLDGGIQFDLPGGTSIEPHDYLVIAKQPDALAQTYPAIADHIVGAYVGRLNNQTDRLALKDDRGNPADVITYFENGAWPSAADGGGASLELRDPNADNSSSLAWSASIEGDDSPWVTYTYQGVAGTSAVGPDNEWHELILGLLDAGEVLLDDISVVQDPDGEAIELIQNGSFENDTVGDEAGTWRIIGNHRHSQVTVDPDDSTNKVLSLVATGATEHMHNHAETTLKNGDDFVQIARNTAYLISYRAKWLSGSNQLNSRLYFNRLPRTTLLERTDTYGTPGRQNSVYLDNLGPTYDQLSHWPAVPQPDEPITVTVAAQDRNGIEDLTLQYAVSGGPWTSVSMVGLDTGQYSGQIPGQPAGEIVQFYIEGRDGLGATAEFPQGGPESRALIQVDDGRPEDNGLHNLRLILTPDDADFLHSDVELMSNDLIAATVVYNESEVFYNVGVRLSGSQRARPFQPRLSFKVGFNSDQLFRGVHGSLILDRSESTGFGQREFIYHHGMNQVGGLPTEYNDLVHVITPRRAHTGSAEMQITRVSDSFLDSQYENGADGQLYEYELVYYPQTTDDRTPEGRKRPTPDGVRGVPITDMGDDKENYRWTFLTKNNRTAGDYDQLIQFAKAMSLRGDEFLDTIGQYIDVDQWLRAFAFSVITGHGDNYGVDGAQHNLQLYIRPSDQKVLQFPHDADAFFNATRPLIANGDLRKLLAAPANEHMYLGHVQDMLQTTFNEAYMQRWTEHFGNLLPAQRFDRHLTDLVRRSDFLEREILRNAPQTAFQVTSDDISVDSSQAMISGTGWVDVREIRLAGSTAPLDVEWTDVTAWEATVPVTLGTSPLTIEAYDFQGELVATDRVTVTSTVDNPVRESLRITELNYNPYAATPAELTILPALNNDDFEFIELTNTGPAAINLLGVTFTDAVQFVFPDRGLAAGQSVVVVSNQDAFRLRYGEQPNVVGQYDGHLNNAGEILEIQDATGAAILAFTYSDDWFVDTDGEGYSLVAVDTTANVSRASGWRPSVGPGGSPGAPEPFLLASGDANRDQAFDQLDIVLVQSEGKYMTGDQATWAQGDWNGDGVFDPLDIVSALQDDLYRIEANLAKAALRSAESDSVVDELFETLG